MVPDSSPQSDPHRRIQNENGDFFLKIVGRGENKHVEMVHGRFFTWIAKIANFFGLSRYDLFSIASLVKKQLQRDPKDTVIHGAAELIRSPHCKNTTRRKVDTVIEEIGQHLLLAQDISELEIELEDELTIEDEPTIEDNPTIDLEEPKIPSETVIEEVPNESTNTRSTPTTGMRQVGKCITKTIAMPLHIMAQCMPAEKEAQTISNGFLKLIGGTVFATAWSVEKVFSGLEYALRSAYVGQVGQQMTVLGKELVNESTEHAKKVSHSQGEVIQKGITVTQWGTKVVTSFIPGANLVVDATANTISEIEKVSRKIDTMHLNCAQKIHSYVLDCFKYLIPSGLKLTGNILSVVNNYVITPLKNMSWKLWDNPAAINQMIQNLADRLDSYSARLWYCFDEDQGEIETKEQVKHDLSSDVFQGFNGEAKVKLFHIVSEYATLSHQDRTLLSSPELRYIQTAEDWKNIPPQLCEQVEKVILDRFNSLPVKHKNRLLALSSNEYRQLSVEDQRNLFESLKKRVEKSNDENAKRIFKECAERGENGILEREDDIQSFIKLYSTFFSKEEQFFLFSQFQEQVVALCPVTNETLQELIIEQKKKLEQVESPEEKKKIEQVLQWLEEQERSFYAHPDDVSEVNAPPISTHIHKKTKTSSVKETIDIKHIDEKIGPHVGTGEAIGEWVGAVPKYMAKALGVPAWAFIKGVGYLAKPNGFLIPQDSPLRSYLPAWMITEEGYLRGSKGSETIENWMELVMKGTAIGTDVLLGFDFLHQGFASCLQHVGVPTEAIEETLRMLPAQLQKAYLGILSLAPRAIEGITSPVKSFAAYILASKETPEMLKKAQEESGKLNEYAKQVGGMVEQICKEGEGKLLCDVQEVLNHEKWPELAKNWGVSSTSPEFLEKIMTALRSAKIEKNIQPVISQVSEPSKWAFVNAIKGVFSFFKKPVYQNVVKPVQEKTFEFLGYEQKVPGDLQTKIKQMFDTYSHLTQVKEQITLNEQLIQGYDQLLPEVVSRAVKSEKGQEFAQYYMKNIQDPIDFGVNILNPALPYLHMGQQRYETLLGAKQVSSIIYETEEALRKKLLEQLESSEPSTIKQVGTSVLQHVSYVSFAARMLSGSALLFPRLIRMIVPPVLNNIAPKIGTHTQNLFYRLADVSYEGIEGVGSLVQKGFKKMGGFMQSAYHYVSGHVSKQRIDEFLQLSKQEQQHVIDLVIQSGQLPTKDIEELKQYGHLISTLNIETSSQIALLAIKGYDLLTTGEKLACSPTYFDHLSEETQHRIRDLVAKKIGLTETERVDSIAIVKKFNMLSFEERQSIDFLSVWDYNQLSYDEKDDLLFIAAHSAKQGTPLECFQEMKAWRNGISNKKLEKILHTYGRIDRPGKDILTPTRLKKMQPATVEHILDIVMKYRAGAVLEFKKKGYDLRKLPALLQMQTQKKTMTLGLEHQKKQLMTALASCFQDLELHQQQEMLLFTHKELAEMSSDEKQELLTFLIAQPELEKSIPFIKEMMVRLSRNQLVNDKKMMTLFNGLSHAAKSEFRSNRLQSDEVQENAMAICEKEMEEEMQRAKLYAKRITKVRGDLYTLGLRIDDCELQLQQKKEPHEILRLEKQLKNDKQKQVEYVQLLEHHEQELTKSKAILSSLKQILPPERHHLFPDIEASPLPPEWLTSIPLVADHLSNQITAHFFKASLLTIGESKNKKQFEERVETIKLEFDKVLIENKKDWEKKRDEEKELREQMNQAATPQEKMQYEVKIAFIRSFNYTVFEKLEKKYQEVRIQLDQEIGKLRLEKGFH